MQCTLLRSVKSPVRALLSETLDREFRRPASESSAAKQLYYGPI